MPDQKLPYPCYPQTVKWLGMVMDITIFSSFHYNFSCPIPVFPTWPPLPTPVHPSYSISTYCMISPSVFGRTYEFIKFERSEWEYDPFHSVFCPVISDTIFIIPDPWVPTLCLLLVKASGISYVTIKGHRTLDLTMSPTVSLLFTFTHPYDNLTMFPRPFNHPCALPTH